MCGDALILKGSKIIQTIYRNEPKDILNLFWGKAKKNIDDNEIIYQPVMYHLINAGCIAQNLWDNINNKIKNDISLKYNVSIEEMRNFIGFLVSIHDIGKISPGFQSKQKEIVDLLKLNGFSFGEIESKENAHNIITTNILSNIDKDIAVMHGGHHGSFPKPTDIYKNKFDDSWNEAIDVSISTLKKIFNPPELQINDNLFLIYFCGLTIVADWISSDEKNFEIKNEQEDYFVYFEKCKIKSKEIIKNLSFEIENNDLHKEFSEIFTNIETPNILQEKIIELTSNINSPCCILIEAPTGFGKTEASFYLAYEIDRRIGSNGISLSLPTQATSNSMFNRFKSFLEDSEIRDKINLHLLHGLSSMSKDYQKLQNVNSEDKVVAEKWFSYNKVGLLSPFSIGTIDQVLLSVLMTKFFPVKFFGLCNKTLIFDEVHAFDVYTTSLMKRLIGCFSMMGCSIILLSATLPYEKKKELLSSYAGKEINIGNIEYPSVSMIDNSGNLKSFSFDIQEKKEIFIKTIDDNENLICDTIINSVKDGGCAAFVCNTVKKSQYIYRLIKDKCPEDIEVILLHSRFPWEQRNSIEKSIIDKFGTKGKEGRPKKSIVVSTQIIEQSLDIDFDIMFSEYAPIDLLLQRIGRLYRHLNNKRPENLCIPYFYIVDFKKDENNIPEIKSNVYDEYVLLKTWLCFQGVSLLKIPDEVEKFINEVYNDKCENSCKEITDMLVSFKSNLDSERKSLEKDASVFMLPDPRNDYYNFLDFIRRDYALFSEDEIEENNYIYAKTRHSDIPNIKVIIFEENEIGDICIRDNGKLKPVEVDKKHSNEMIDLFIKRSSSINGWTFFKYLKECRPDSWKKTLLGGYAPIVFDYNKEFILGNKKIILDEELGLFETNVEE